jgi:hypothetical protein
MIHDACFHLDQSQVNKEIPVHLKPKLWTLHICFLLKLYHIVVLLRLSQVILLDKTLIDIL